MTISHDTICDVCGSASAASYENMYDDRYGHPGVFSIATCINCLTLSTLPPLTIDQIGPLYTHYYPRHIIDLKTVEARGNRIETPSQRFSYWWHGNHKIQHMLPLQGNGRRVLDVGCGDGASLIELKRRGFDASGIETDENVAKVRDAFKLPIHIGTIEDCTFPEHSFDYIIANQVIEHIIDLNSFVAHIKKFLAPQGRVVLSTPNGNSIYRKIFGRKWAHWHIPYHQHILNKKALGILLGKYGMTIISSKTVSPTTWMIHTLNRLRFTPKLGTKNPLWAYEQRESIPDTSLPSTSSNRSGLKKSLKKWAYSITLAIISLCNRIVDMFGAGDCIVVEVRTKA